MIEFENVTLFCDDAKNLGDDAADKLTFDVASDDSGEVSFRMTCERGGLLERYISVNVPAEEARQFANALLAATA